MNDRLEFIKKIIKIRIQIQMEARFTTMLYPNQESLEFFEAVW